MFAIGFEKTLISSLFVACPRDCVDCTDVNNDGTMVCDTCATHHILNSDECGGLCLQKSISFYTEVHITGSKWEPSVKDTQKGEKTCHSKREFLNVND